MTGVQTCALPICFTPCLAAKHGVKLRETLYTVGQYDFVVSFEAPDDATVSRFLLAIAAQGNVRSTTMRAFSVDEMRGIVGKI